MRRRALIPAWRRKLTAEREANLLERYHGTRTTLVGLGTQDPNDVVAWSKSLVRVLYAYGWFFCLDCADRINTGPNPIAMQTEAEELCHACGRRVDAAKALRRVS